MRAIFRRYAGHLAAIAIVALKQQPGPTGDGARPATPTAAGGDPPRTDSGKPQPGATGDRDGKPPDSPEPAGGDLPRVDAGRQE